MRVEMDSRFPLMLFELEAMSTAELCLLSPTPKEKNLTKECWQRLLPMSKHPPENPTPLLPAEACEVGWGLS